MFGNIGPAFNKYKKNITLSGEAAPWYNSSWLNRFKITTNLTYVENGIDFALYDLGNAPSGIWSNMLSSGADLRVASSDGTTIVPMELIHLDYGNNDGVIAFKSDAINSSTTTDYYLYYNNSGASAEDKTSATGSGNVYSSFYTAAYWLQQAPTSNTAMLDSTLNNRNSTSVLGTMTSGDLVADSGPIGNMYSIDFDGTNDRMFFSSTVMDNIETNSNYSINIWAYPTDMTSQDRGIIGTQGSQLRAWIDIGGSNIGWASRHTNSIFQNTFLGENYSSGSLNAWQLVSLVWDSAATTMYLYVNGTLIESVVNDTNIRSATLSFIIGNDNTTFFKGRVAKVTVKSAPDDSNYILTMYNNEFNNSNFWTTSTEESYS